MTKSLIRQVSLGDCVDIVSGFAFDSSRFNSESGMRVVRIRDVVRGWTETYYSGDFEGKYLLSDGDLLVGMDGEFNLGVWSGGEALLNQRVCKIISNESLIDPLYLKYFLPNELKKIEAATSFVTVKHLSVKAIREISIQLPEISEQRMIAETLEKANVVKRNCLHVIHLLDELANSIFESFFYSNSSGVMNIESEFWQKKKIKELGSVTTGKTPPSSQNGMYGTDLPFVTPGDLGRNEPAKRYLSAEGAEFSRNVGPGSLLVCCIGATIGKMSIASETSAFNQQINAVEWNEEIKPSYGLFAMRKIKPFLISQASSTTMPILNKTQFQEIELPVPPISLQIQFENILRDLELIKESCRKQLVLAEELFSSLVAQAFDGEL